jgi:small neutral amino acid transporter SnatA (MarC family)
MLDNLAAFAGLIIHLSKALVPLAAPAIAGAPTIKKNAISAKTDKILFFILLIIFI